MKKERKRKSKKQIRLMQAAGVILCSGGLPFAIFSVDRLFGWNVPLIIVIALVCAAAGILLILSTQRDEVEVEAERLQSTALTAIPGLDQEKVEKTFQEKGYAPVSSNYLFKKHFAFLKDAIYCCVRWAETDQVSEALDVLLPEFDKVVDERPKWRRKNVCLYLFLSVPAATAENKGEVQELAAYMRLFEETHPQGIFRTAIPILVDRETKTGYFLDQSKGIYVYDHGCRRLKKVFS